MTVFGKRIVSAAAAACLLVGTHAMADDSSRAGSAASAGQTGQSQQAGQSDQATGGASQEQMAQALQKADSPDKLFLIGVAVQGQCELQMAQLAQQKSQNPQVKQLAQQLVTEHQQMAQQLQLIIDRQGLQTPQGVPAMARQELKVLSSLQGEQFDKAWLSNVKAAHAMAVSKFRDVSQIAQDDSVKQFATQGLAKLQQHAQQVQQAATAAGLTGGADREAQPAGSRIEGSGSGAGSSGTGTSGSGTSGSGTTGSGTSGSGTSGSGTSGSTGSGTSGSGTSGSGSSGGTSGTGTSGSSTGGTTGTGTGTTGSGTGGGSSTPTR